MSGSHPQPSGPSGGRRIRNLVLTGFMGTGKSSVGRLVAQQLRYTFLDTDDIIQQEAGKSISAIFSEDGEGAFRELERKVVMELSRQDQAVIATGGGLGANAHNLALLKEHAYVVCLWASPEGIYDRVRHQSHRPLLHDPDPMSKIQSLLEIRGPVYRQADALVNTERRSIKEVAQQVVLQFQMGQQKS